MVLPSLWAVARALVLQTRQGNSYLRLELVDEPRLRRLLDEGAARSGCEPLDSVHLTPGAGFVIAERRVRRPEGLAVRERLVLLGVVLLDAMRVIDLKAILARELALCGGRGVLTVPWGRRSIGA